MSKSNAIAEIESLVFIINSSSAMSRKVRAILL
jgi:hypothetical protein